MPYRSDIEAMQSRRDAVVTELAAVSAGVSELESMRARQTLLEQELDDVTRSLANAKKRASLPLLSNVRVASPCRASWEKMSGDDRVRFCGKCKKNVYNLSGMAAAEAEALLQSRRELCVRFYQRKDGTILTQDCPVGLRRRRRKQTLIAATLAIGVAGITAGVATLWGYIMPAKAATIELGGGNHHHMGGIRNPHWDRGPEENVEEPVPVVIESNDADCATGEPGATDCE